MLLTRFLDKAITRGTLILTDADNHSHVVEGREAGPEVHIRLHDKALHHRLLRNPFLFVGEAYMEGTLTIERGTLRDFLVLVGENGGSIGSTRLVLWLRRLQRLKHWLVQHNPGGIAQRRVAHHYDLSDELYDLFLDDDRQYSCAYFRDPANTLEQAQADKKGHIAAKLCLERGQSVLDIGCGWGGLGLYLARLGAGRVLGITLSERQEQVANQRAMNADLGDRLHFRLQDYRELAGRFDRIVSVGMFEHVGVHHYREFFQCLKDRLEEDGVALLHTIGRMERPGATNPWLGKYIFPGGYTPALSEIVAAVEQVGELCITDVEVLRLHYAKTLSHWHERFQQHRERVATIYDERFCRMWEFYLLSCEISFLYFNQVVFQIQITRRPDAVPLTRDYIGTWERHHAHDDTHFAAVASTEQGMIGHTRLEDKA